MIQALKKIFQDNSNSENAFAMSKYLKFKFEHFGIKKPERALLQKPLLNGALKLDIALIFDIVFIANWKVRIL